MKLKILALSILITICQNAVKAQNPYLTFTQFSNGKLDDITAMVNAGDKRMFVVQQYGIIAILDSAGNVLPKPFLNIVHEADYINTEEGLLGLAFSPNYKNDGYFYVHYTDSNYNIHIARFQVSPTNPDSALNSSETTVLQIYHPYQNHNGGDLQFGPDGYLYDGLGDGGSAGDPGNRAQNLDSLLGKMLRIDVSSLPYKIPPTNPFVGDTGRPEIWAYGLRNPWCFSFDRLKGDMWIGDVGQDKWEEVDYQPGNDTGGENYGWRCYEGDAPYNMSDCAGITNFTFPIDTYYHTATNGCAIIGGCVYRGAEYKSLFGKYFYTDFCSGLFRSIEDSAGVFKRTLLNVLATSQCTRFGQDIYGNLYVSEREPGYVFKIGDTACAPVAFISFSDTIYATKDTAITALYAPDLTYQWKFNNNPIGSGDTIPVTASGIYSVTVTNGTGCSSSASEVVIISATTGSNRLKTFKNVQIAPNPNNGAFDLTVSATQSTNSTIIVYDVLGRVDLTKNTFLNAGKNIIPINESDLSPGIYFLKINSQPGQSVIKFVVAE